MKNSSACFRTALYPTPAKSPAFEIDGSFLCSFSSQAASDGVQNCSNMTLTDSFAAYSLECYIFAENECFLGAKALLSSCASRNIKYFRSRFEHELLLNVG